MTFLKRKRLVSQAETYFLKQILPLFDIETDSKPLGHMRERFLRDNYEVLWLEEGCDPKEYGPKEYTMIMNQARRNLKGKLKKML